MIISPLPPEIFPIPGVYYFIQGGQFSMLIYDVAYLFAIFPRLISLTPFFLATSSAGFVNPLLLIISFIPFLIAFYFFLAQSLEM